MLKNPAKKTVTRTPKEAPAAEVQHVVVAPLARPTPVHQGLGIAELAAARFVAFKTVNAIITLVSEFSTTHAEALGKNLQLLGDKATRDARFSHIQRMQKTGLRAKIYDGAVKYVPCIPATALRAALGRSPCADKWLEERIRAGKPITLEDILFVKTGQAPTEGSNAETGQRTVNITAKVNERILSPYLAMWGHFTQWSENAYQAAYPKTVVELEYYGGVKGDPVAPYYQYLSDEEKARYHEVRSAHAAIMVMEDRIKELKAQVDGMPADAVAERKKAEDEISKLQKDAEARRGGIEKFKVSILMPLPSVHYIPAGTVFDHGIEVRGVDPIVNLSQVLFGLNRAIENNTRLGGHKGHGFGQFKAEYPFSVFFDGQSQHLFTAHINAGTEDDRLIIEKDGKFIANEATVEFNKDVKWAKTVFEAAVNNDSWYRVV